MTPFDPDRYGFCIIGGNLIIMDAKDRGMSTQVWMEDVLRLSKESIDTMPRGYLLPGRIQFFTGNYDTCPTIGEDIVGDAVACYASLYGVHNTQAIATPIYNGCHRGKVGDTWEPVLKWDFDIGRWEVFA